MNNSNSTTFWKYLKDNRIVIPIIQRSYAQGRFGKEYLREKFLNNLVNALNGGKPILLDFVYGSESHGCIEPLDGQQRLTTLWLLHWYVALKCGRLAENKETFKHFTYETRVSSRRFTDAICDIEHIDGDEGVAAYIQRRTWFLDAWHNDPTVKAMLTMIEGTKINDNEGRDITDGLEEIFSGYDKKQFEEIWLRLTDEQACPIRFYALNMSDSNLPLSDDLYIKMNARGRVLSDFENFKADLIDYIRKSQADGMGNGCSIHVGALLDNKWMDVFWRTSGHPAGVVDEVFMAFLNRFFLTKIILSERDNTETTLSFRKLYGASGNDTAFRYDNFECYEKSGVLCGDTFTQLEAIFGRVSKITDINQLCKPRWETKASNDSLFIPVYTDEKGITGIGQRQRVVFAAACIYLERHDYDGQKFADWMRFAWNMAENSGIYDVESMKRVIRSIGRYAENSDDILRHLSSLDPGEVKNAQLKEEIVKAMRICQSRDGDAPETEQHIYEAESYGFFRGAIRFLFTDGGGNVDWSNFEDKFTNAQNLLQKAVDTADASLMCYLISMFTSWEQIHLFEDNTAYFSNKGDNWKALLTSDKLQDPVDRLLRSKDIPAELYPAMAETGSGCTDVQIKVQQDLCDINLMNDVLANVKGAARLRWNWWHHTIYKPYERNERLIYFTADRRNDMLSELSDRKEFILNEDRALPGGRHFAGVNIPFTFNGRAFLWSWDDYIYIDSSDRQAKMTSRYKVNYDEIDCYGLCRKFERMIETVPE